MRWHISVTRPARACSFFVREGDAGGGACYRCPHRTRCAGSCQRAPCYRSSSDRPAVCFPASSAPTGGWRVSRNAKPASRSVQCAGPRWRRHRGRRGQHQRTCRTALATARGAVRPAGRRGRGPDSHALNGAGVAEGADSSDVRGGRERLRRAAVSTNTEVNNAARASCAGRHAHHVQVNSDGISNTASRVSHAAAYPGMCHRNTSIDQREHHTTNARSRAPDRRGATTRFESHATTPNCRTASTHTARVGGPRFESRSPGTPTSERG